MPDRPSIRPEQLIEGLLKTIPSGFYVVENRIIIGVNDYILELSGYAREELIGQSARIFFLSDAIFDQVGTEVSRQSLRRNSIATKRRNPFGYYAVRIKRNKEPN